MEPVSIINSPTISEPVGLNIKIDRGNGVKHSDRSAEKDGRS